MAGIGSRSRGAISLNTSLLYFTEADSIPAPAPAVTNTGTGAVENEGAFRRGPGHMEVNGRNYGHQP